MAVTTVFFLLISITFAELKCEKGWVMHESKCYKVNAELVTWFEARMKCKQNRSDLAVIENEQDQKFLTGQIQQEVWIGLNDRQQEMKYVWLDKDLQVSPAYWKRGNPSNTILGAMFSENCVAMGYTIGNQDHGKWVDYPCAFKLGFVCQRLAGQEASTLAVTDLFLSLNNTGQEASTLAVTDLSPANSAGCAGGWTMFQSTNQCYKKGEDKLTWADAREACRAWNANLVTVRSLEEGQFLAGIAQNEQNVWIGISAIPGDHSTWLTVDRDTISFSNWGPGEPDNNHTESEHCALEKVSIRTWHDVNCQRRESYVCIKRDQPARACSEGWIKDPATNTCYRFDKTIKKWHEAESACQTRNSHLASITSEDEFNFVVGTARNNQGLSSVFWIGLHDKTVENKWEWTDGTPFLWSKWQPNQPDDWHGSEDCAGVTLINLFNDYYCTEKNMFVCERQAIVSGSCDVGWEKDPNTGVCFKFGTEKKTWNNSRTACQELGGDLANIKSPDEQLFIYNKVHAFTNSTGIWIGASDTGIENEWKGIDGSLLTYTDWAPGEPNNIYGTEHCASISLHITPELNGHWNDALCSLENIYVCQSSGIAWNSRCGFFWETSVFKGFCYQINEVQVTWNVAHMKCKQDGGDLISITSQSEQSYIDGLLLSKLSQVYWIGVNDLGNEGSWRWSNGDPYVYFNWAKGELNEYGKGEDCGSIISGSEEKYMWNAMPCNNTFGYICKKSAIDIKPNVISRTSETTEHLGLTLGCWRIVGIIIGILGAFVIIGVAVYVFTKGRVRAFYVSRKGEFTNSRYEND